MIRIVLITSSARWTWMSFLSSSIGSSAGCCRSRAAVVSFGISTTMSGVMPLPWIDRPFGVKYLAVVSRSPEPSDSGMIVCTEPFPKVWLPTTIALPQSWSAPPTISEPEALPWFTRTTSGKFAHDGDRHLRPGLAAHALDGVGKLHVFRDEAVDLHDAIAGQEAGPVRRRALDRRHHREDVVTQGDLDAETTEAPAGLDLHLLVTVRVEERAMRIEAAQGSLDRVVDEVLRRDLVDVLVLHDGEDLGEELQLLVRGAAVRALAGHGSAER